MKAIVFLAVLICCLCPFHGWAQTTAKLKFTAAIQAGILHGSSTNSFQINAINGFQYKTWSGGVGVGIDYYYLRTVPVFIDLRKNIFNRTQTPFVFMDLGVNFPWVKEQVDNLWMESNYRSGIYGTLGIGYKTPINKKLAINICLGYSRKELHKTISYYSFTGRPPDGRFKAFSEKYFYQLSRISLSTGIIF